MNTQLHRSVRWGLSLMLGLLLAGLVAPPSFAAGPAPAHPAGPATYCYPIALFGDTTNYEGCSAIFQPSTLFMTSGKGTGWFFNTLAGGTAVVASCTNKDGVSLFCNGLKATGNSFGMQGITYSDGGVGLEGVATSSSGDTQGVKGVLTQAFRDGSAVEGYAGNPRGDAWGVYGHTLATEGVGVVGNGAVTGVYGQTYSSSGNAVEGDAPSTSGRITGVYGETENGAGFGVVGTSPYVGVYSQGTGPGAQGMWAVSDYAIGLSAQSDTGRGAFISTNTGPVALEVNNPNTGSGHYAIVADGDVLVKGNLYTTKGGPVPYSPVTTDQGPRAMYAAAGTRTLLSDQGTGRLVAGRAVITLDPLYAQTVDLSADYQVFLTPSGADTLGLGVVNKTATSFEVRELQGGHGAYRFDWRIDAVRKGYATTRMAAAPPDSVAPALPVAPVAPPPPPARPALPHSVAPAPQAPPGSAPPAGK